MAPPSPTPPQSTKANDASASSGTSMKVALHDNDKATKNEKLIDLAVTPEEGRKRKAASDANLEDAIDDEVALHHSSPPTKKVVFAPSNESRRKFTNHEAAVHQDPRSAHKSPHGVSQTKDLMHSKGSRLSGFDSISLSWLQRMEEVATVWLNMLVQQQQVYSQYTDNFSKEKQRIVEFCTRTLQEILSEGGFRNYMTPALYCQQLPPLQDLPCMVATLQYWYCALLRRCQHQTAVTMIPHRVLAPEQISRISVEDYVGACEAEVKRWLRNLGAFEKEPNQKSYPIGKVQGDPSQVARWMQHLRTASIPSYSPVRPKPSQTAAASVKGADENVKGNRMPSPTDVMMFHSVAAPTYNSVDLLEKEYEDKKLPAKKLPPSNIVQTHQRSMSKEKASRMRGLILSLYHANKCPFGDPEDGNSRRCPVSKGCCKVKELWQHITTDSNRRCCVQNTCPFGRLSLEAEEALKHYGHCKKEICKICGPVMEQMPKVKYDIEVAIDVARRQAKAVEAAILQVVDELSNEFDPLKKSKIRKKVVTTKGKVVPEPEIVESIKTQTTKDDSKKMVSDPDSKETTKESIELIVLNED